MKTSKPVLELQSLSSRIVAPLENYGQLREDLMALRALFIANSILDWESEDTSNYLYLESGQAIGPKWAGLCIEDQLRTHQFINGIYTAIQDLLAIKLERPIKILYVGTGPFATLALPLTTLLTPSEIQFDLVEVNPLSFKNLQHLVEVFNANSYIQNIIQADATQLEIQDPESIDIFVVECLQHALEREPQVTIAHHIIPQLRPDCIMIPHEIKLDLCLANTSVQGKYHMGEINVTLEDFLTKIATVFVLNKDSILKRSESNVLDFPKEIYEISQIQLEHKDFVFITTEIIIYKDFMLGYNDSGLTIPLIVFPLDSKKELLAISCQYITGNAPYLKTEMIRKSPL